MKLPYTLISPEGIAFEGEADEVYLLSSNGPIGFAPGYADFIGALASSSGLMAKNGLDVLYFELYGGAYRVEGGRLKVISNRIEVRNSQEEHAQSLLAKGYNCPL